MRREESGEERRQERGALKEENEERKIGEKRE